MQQIEIPFDSNVTDPITYSGIPGVWEKAFIRGKDRGKPVFWETMVFIPHAYVPDLEKQLGHVDFRLELPEGVKQIFG